jgi:hypothetical protein
MAAIAPPYHQSRAIGRVADGVTKEGAMALLQANPSDFFPFRVHGLGSSAYTSRLQLGREYNLVGVGPPGDDPIEIAELTATSFTFLTLPGHFDGVGGTIKFSTVERGGVVYLEHDAKAPDTGYLVGTFAPYFAGQAWDYQAAALRDALQGGREVDIPGWGTWATPGGPPPESP